MFKVQYVKSDDMVIYAYVEIAGQPYVIAWWHVGSELLFFVDYVPVDLMKLDIHERHPSLNATGVVSVGDDRKKKAVVLRFVEYRFADALRPNNDVLNGTAIRSCKRAIRQADVRYNNAVAELKAAKAAREN